MTKKLQVVLNDETEERFREAVFKTKGMKKGNISEAMEEAIELWIQEQLEKERVSKRQK